LQHVFWLREGKIAGRSGPNTDAWDLDEIKAGGFAAILSVNGGEAVHETLLDELGIAYANIPMSANAPARDGDREICLQNIPRAMAFIRENLESGPVLIHCRAGKDRTGMVMAAYLMTFEDYDAKAAMQQVFEVRPIAFTAEGWKEFGLEVLSHYQAGSGEPRI
jgi:protein tyrosine phosphatase (PTP) superfamily phosphohydrolase (DUF442 family)